MARGVGPEAKGVADDDDVGEAHDGGTENGAHETHGGSVRCIA